MQDRFFLALYRSNDPKERATAMDKLNKAQKAYRARQQKTMSVRLGRTEREAGECRV
jgi:hypothetical protein